jgi:hypothetical protein
MNEKQKSKNGAIPHAALLYLRNAGWTPKRVVPTSLYEQAFEAEGIPFLPKTKNFLRKFGGLIIRYAMRSGQEDVLEFLAERAVQGMGGSGLEGFEERIDVAPLCPIGHHLFGTCMLFMDSRGRVFGGSDETVTFVGKTGEEAISKILTGVESQPLESRAS